MGATRVKIGVIARLIQLTISIEHRVKATDFHASKWKACEGMDLEV